jgi:predicted DCC family thiol-disulfide oxidoreductase YuxK
MTERTSSTDDPAAGSGDADADVGAENASADDASTGGSADVDVGQGDDTDVDLATVADEGPVLLFDGVCNLCNGAVQFVIERDPEGRIRFASLQSAVGQAVLDRLDLPTDELETVVLLEGDRAYTRSAAAIRVCELLGGPYRTASVGWLLPRRVRDRLYAFVAEHRYEWFGRKDQCTMPTPELQARFVE